MVSGACRWFCPAAPSGGIPEAQGLGCEEHRVRAAREVLVLT